MAQAYRYYLAGKAGKQSPRLEKVQTWYPRANVDASYMLGICYLQTQDYDHARGAFAKMFDVPADSAASYLFSARMLLRQQFDPVAEQYALKAVAIDSKLPLAHFLLGELYIFKSRIPDAIAEFEKELAINPGNAAAYYKLADAYSRMQKVRRCGAVAAALHLAGCHVHRALHPDGQGVGQKGRARTSGPGFAARAVDGSQ